jgi:hypothetical protein
MTNFGLADTKVFFPTPRQAGWLQCNQPAHIRCPLLPLSSPPLGEVVLRLSTESTGRVRHGVASTSLAQPRAGSRSATPVDPCGQANLC